jgi:glycosyltransferase involved in cell wall biosynthesis
MLFTIAIPTYNNGSTVAIPLRSALNQTYSGDYEVLVVNNCSTDDTATVLFGFRDDRRLRAIHNSETFSIHKNHNICLQNARGKYVLFCHSDDALDPRALDNIYVTLSHRGFPDKYVLWGYSFYFDYSDTLASEGFYPGQLFAGARACRIFLEAGLAPSGTCYSRDICEIGGFIVPDPDFGPSDAATMVLAAMRGYRFEMLQEIIVYRYGASTALRGRDALSLISEHDQAFRALFRILEENELNRLFEQAVKRRAAPFLFYGSVSWVLPRQAALGVFSTLVRRPYYLRRRKVRIVLTRVVRNWIRSKSQAIRRI